MKEVFNDLDMTSEVLEILLSPEKPYFQLSTFGNAGSTHVSTSAISLKQMKCIQSLVNARITLLLHKLY